MIVQMEFAMKGKFQTCALDFRIILQVFPFFPENANVPKRPKWDSYCINVVETTCVILDVFAFQFISSINKFNVFRIAYLYIIMWRIATQLFNYPRQQDIFPYSSP